MYLHFYAEEEIKLSVWEIYLSHYHSFLSICKIHFIFLFIYNI